MTKQVSLEDLLNDQDDQAKVMKEWLEDYDVNQEEMSPRLYGPNVPKQREITQEELEEKLKLSRQIIEGKIPNKSKIFIKNLNLLNLFCLYNFN